MTNEDVQRLQSAGLSESFLRIHQERGLPTRLFWLSSTFALAAMIAFLLSGLIFLITWVTQQTWDNAANAARELDALAYFANGGLSLLPLIFGGIFASDGLTLILPQFLSRDRRVAYALRAALSLLRDDRTHSYVQGRIRRIVYEYGTGNEAEALLSWHYRRLRWSVLGLSLCAAGLLMLPGDLNAHVLFTRDGIQDRGMFPPYHEKTILWSDASRVQLGCNQTRDSASIIYEVTFNDGSKYRLSDTTRYRDDLLDVLEHIDREIETTSGSFERWEWLGRNPAHPECLRHWRRELGSEDFARFAQLLRLTPEELHAAGIPPPTSSSE